MLTLGVVQLEGCRCRCGHEWLTRPRGVKPRVCPKCKSANWDKPKLFERGRKSRVGQSAKRTGVDLYPDSQERYESLRRSKGFAE